MLCMASRCCAARSRGAGNLTIADRSLRLQGGTFIAPSGTLTLQSAFINSPEGFVYTSGSFVHNNGTLSFAKLSWDTVLSTVSRLHIHNLIVNMSDRSLSTTGSGVIVDGTLTLQSGKFNNPNLVEARGNVQINAPFAGSTTTSTLLLDGTGAQLLGMQGGSIAPSGTFTIAKPSGTVTLSGALVLNSAGQNLIMTGGTLNLNGFGLTVNKNLTIGTGTTLKLKGTETLTTSKTFLQKNSTVWYTEPSQTVRMKSLGSSNYQNLILGSTGSAVFQLPAKGLSMSGALTISGGTLQVDGGQALTVSGSWLKTSNPAAAFSAGTGTVVLSGSHQTLSGSTTFYTLTKTTSLPKVLTVAAGSLQTVTHALTLQGASGSLLLLRSSLPGTAWSIDPQATRSMAYLDLQDGNNINATAIDCITGCRDSGRNTGWLFPGENITTTTLSTSPSSPIYGQNVLLTATVSPSAATHTFTFKDGATTLGTANVGHGSGSYTVTAPAVGSHSYTAVYSGDTTYQTSTSAAVPVTVGQMPSTTTLTSSLNPSTYSVGTLLTATVSPSFASGTVTFFDGVVSLGTATLSHGSGTLTTHPLTFGSHSLTAVYGGSLTVGASTSTVLTQTVTIPGLDLHPGSYGATADQGETDDPATDGVAYAGNVYYVDCVNGDDSLSGLSSTVSGSNGPWRTLVNIRTKTEISYWDTVGPNGNTNPPYHDPWTAAPSYSAFLLKRGCSFSGSIAINVTYPSYNDHYTFGAYGDRSQPRPIIRLAALPAAGLGLGQVIWDNGFPITVRNLHLISTPSANNSGIWLLNTDGASIINTVMENSATNGIGADGADNLTIENSFFINNYGQGFGGGGANLRILNSTFINNGSDKIGNHNIYARHLSGAVIQGNLLIGGANLGIVLHGTSTGVTIRGNDIHGNSNGLMISGYGGTDGASDYFKNLLIEHNLIHDNGYRVSDQGYGIMLQSLTGAIIRNNLVYGNRLGTLNVSDTYVGDVPLTNVQIVNNIISAPRAGNVALSGPHIKNLSMYNNIFMNYQGGTSNSALTKTAISGSELRLDNNLYYQPNRSDGKLINYDGTDYTLSGLTAATGQEPHGVSAQPLFADEAHGNYRTLAGSPVINAGTGSAAVPDDFNGTARPQGGNIDIGPYQYTGGDTTPPTVSGVQATNLRTTTATIGWTTGEAATSQVQFGTTTDYGLSTPFDSGATVSHTVSLGRLLSGTGYHFRVVSVDVAGNIALSPDATFSTTSLETVTVLTSSQNPSASGSSVTLTASVTPSTATGTLTFLDGATTIGTATLGHGSGSITTGSLAVGSHSLTAVYAGNSSYPPSTSNTVTQVVESAGLTASTTTLTSSVNPTIFGASTILTATVSPDTATGTVTFKDGSTTIGTVTVSHGSGTLAISAARRRLPFPDRRLWRRQQRRRQHLEHRHPDREPGDEHDHSHLQCQPGGPR